MLVKLTEIYKIPGERIHLSEIFVSKEAVISIRSEQGSIVNEAIALGISEHAGFSKLTYNEGGISRTITVVGEPHEIRTKLGGQRILKG